MHLKSKCKNIQQMLVTSVTAAKLQVDKQQSGITLQEKGTDVHEEVDGKTMSSAGAGSRE